VVKLKPFLKTYREAGSLNSLLAPHAFIDEHVFLTKANQLGVTFRVSGIDDECLTAETLDSYTKRITAAFRGFSERFRIYQYIVKQDRAQIEQSDSFPTEAVRSTVLARREHLQSKASGLYTLDLYFVILYEPLGISDGAIKQAVRGLTKRNVSTKSVLRVAAHELAQSRDALMGQAISLQRTIGDLLGLQMLGKREVFSLFRLLCNLDPQLASSEHLKHDTHIDYYMASALLACSSEGIKIGDADVEVLSLRDTPAHTFPHLLRDLLKLETNFILCSEFKRVLNEQAITTIRTAQNFFHYAQYLSDLPSLLSMIMNRGKTSEVIPDKSALVEKDALDDSVARINNQGEYLGEFSFTVLLYGWGKKARLEAAAVDVVKIFGNHEGSLFRESYNALNAYLSIIPGNHAFSLRKTWLLSKNYADLSFVYAPYTGEKKNKHLGCERRSNNRPQRAA